MKKQQLRSRLLDGDTTKNASLESLIDSAADNIIDDALKLAEMGASDGLIIDVLKKK